MSGVVGRRLAARHGVDQVIDADHLEVDVAARGMNQVIAADGGQIAVAASTQRRSASGWRASVRWQTE